MALELPKGVQAQFDVIAHANLISGVIFLVLRHASSVRPYHGPSHQSPVS